MTRGSCVVTVGCLGFATATALYITVSVSVSWFLCLSFSLGSLKVRFKLKLSASPCLVSGNCVKVDHYIRMDFPRLHPVRLSYVPAVSSVFAKKTNVLEEGFLSSHAAFSIIPG